MQFKYQSLEQLGVKTITQVSNDEMSLLRRGFESATFWSKAQSKSAEPRTAPKNTPPLSELLFCGHVHYFVFTEQSRNQDATAPTAK